MSKYDEVPQGSTCLCCGDSLQDYDDLDLPELYCGNGTCPLFCDDVVVGEMVDMYLMGKIRRLVDERDRALKQE